MKKLSKITFKAREVSFQILSEQEMSVIKGGLNCFFKCLDYIDSDPNYTYQSGNYTDSDYIDWYKKAYGIADNHPDLTNGVTLERAMTFFENQFAGHCSGDSYYRSNNQLNAQNICRTLGSDGSGRVIATIRVGSQEHAIVLNGNVTTDTNGVPSFYYHDPDSGRSGTISFTELTSVIGGIRPQKK